MNVHNKIKKFFPEVIWIQASIHEFQSFIEYNIEKIKPKFIENPKDAFNYIKKIKYEKTDIVLGDIKSAKEFFEILKSHISELSIIPRIFIKSDKTFINSQNNFLDYPLFHSDLIENSIRKICKLLNQKDELFADNIPLIEMRPDDKMFSFEYLVDKINLKLPLYYKFLVKIPTDNEIKRFNKFLKNKPYKLNQDNNKFNQNQEFTYLMEQIDRIEKIPLKIPFPLLVKYWLRIYSFETKFYSEMNYTFLKKKYGRTDYDVYVRALYNGFEFIPFFFKENLYRGAFISNEEIKTMKECLK